MPQFDFYLLSKSFQYQENTPLDILRQRIENMADDCDMMRINGDKIYKNNSIYEVSIYEDMEIQDIIWPNTDILTRDQRNALQKIIDRSHETNLDDTAIIDLLARHDKDSVSGILSLHRIDDINNRFLVYDKNDWYVFHRYFLGVYPISEQFFYDECVKYFPKIYFHERVVGSLSTFDGGFLSFVEITVKCLTALNDELHKHISNNIPLALKAFSSASGIETTNEGNVNRKIAFTFNFPYSNQENQEKKERKSNLLRTPHENIPKR